MVNSNRLALDSERNEKIPVLLLVRELGIGGTERQLVETARFLQSGRFVPHVGCFRSRGLRRQDLDSAGVPILHLPLCSFKSAAVITVARKLIRYIRENRIHVVHSFDAPLNVFAVPVARLAGTPAVLSSQRGDRNLTSAVNHHLLRITDRMVDAVVVNCEAMVRYLVEQEGVPQEKVRLCYNAVDVERFRRQATPVRERLVIGSVCALRPEKGLDTLIKAFAEIRDAGATLLIVGSGPEEHNLRALCAQLGISHDCHFEPATTNVAEWLSRIDIFVLPSRSEALSNALMEAMACACCPVATKVGGTPELIDPDENGLLFEVHNVGQLATQLRSLLADEGRRKRLADAASAKMSARFTYAKAAATMQSIYESVLNAKQQKARRRYRSGD